MEAMHGSEIYKSSYFQEEFNTAIFDGPLRIYFSQREEPSALLLYFRIQNYLTARLKSHEKPPKGRILYILLYEDTESFARIFGSGRVTGVQELDDDFVIGLRGPISEDQFPYIIERVDEIMDSW